MQQGCSGFAVGASNSDPLVDRDAFERHTTGRLRGAKSMRRRNGFPKCRSGETIPTPQLTSVGLAIARRSCLLPPCAFGRMEVTYDVHDPVVKAERRMKRVAARRRSLVHSSDAVRANVGARQNPSSNAQQRALRRLPRCRRPAIEPNLRKRKPTGVPRRLPGGL